MGTMVVCLGLADSVELTSGGTEKAFESKSAQRR